MDDRNLDINDSVVKFNQIYMPKNRNNDDEVMMVVVMMTVVIVQ